MLILKKMTCLLFSSRKNLLQTLVTMWLVHIQGNECLQHGSYLMAMWTSENSSYRNFSKCNYIDQSITLMFASMATFPKPFSSLGLGWSMTEGVQCQMDKLCTLWFGTSFRLALVFFYCKEGKQVECS